MAQVNIKEIVDFVTKGNCPFSRDEVYTALTTLNMEGKNIKRKEDYKEESDFIVDGDLCSSIDDIIKNLQELKEEGWEEIDRNYDYFYAYKYIEEPDEEYRNRLLALIKNQLKIMTENDEEHIIQKINEKKKEIAELEKKLNKNIKVELKITK